MSARSRDLAPSVAREVGSAREKSTAVSSSAPARPPCDGMDGMATTLRADVGHVTRRGDLMREADAPRGRPGEVAEWSIAPHSKCGVRASAPGVRIPPSPPELPLIL